eukprot:764153-Hanusia_phi.AAC.12
MTSWVLEDGSGTGALARAAGGQDAGDRGWRNELLCEGDAVSEGRGKEGLRGEGDHIEVLDLKGERDSLPSVEAAAQGDVD